MFKKGDYIVTLIDNGSCGRKNYCSKQRQDYDCLAPEIDTIELKNNYNEVFTCNDQSGTKWRWATKEECVQYEIIGKPYDVTTLKQPDKLIMEPGSFYYVEWDNKMHYIIRKGIAGSENINLCVEQHNSFSLTGFFNSPDHINSIRIATPEERNWLEACIASGKWEPKPEEIKVGTWVTVLPNARSLDGKALMGKTFQVSILIQTKTTNTYYAEGYKELLEEGLWEQGIWLGELRLATQQEIKNVIGKTRKKAEPPLNMVVNMDALIAEAKRRYPIGTTFKDLVNHTDFVVRESIITSYYVSGGVALYIAVEPKPGYSNASANIWSRGQWAPIIRFSTRKFKDVTHYKKGDRVVCIKVTEGPNIGPGSGWQQGLVFEVTEEVTRIAQQGAYQILYGGLDGNGVYSSHVRPVGETASYKPIRQAIQASIQAVQTGRISYGNLSTAERSLLINPKVKLQKPIERKHKRKRIRRREVL